MKLINTFPALLLAMAVAAPSLSARHSDVKLTDGWTFTRIDVPTDSAASFRSTPPSGQRSTTVSIPHDWSTALPYSADAPSGNDGGYFTAGTGWYTRTLDIPQSELSMRHELVIDGAYEDAQVFVNDSLAGGHHYGYSTFSVDLTPYLHAGENTLTIRVDNSRQRNCRWYTGSGIYRPVHLVTTSPSRINDRELFAYSKFNPADSSWVLSVDAPFETAGNSGLSLRHILTQNAGGKKVADVEVTVAETEIPVASPLLWSPDAPNLYTLTTLLLDADSQVIDSVTATTGFRHIEYDAENGLRLNFSPIILNGGCVHHDCGILGARSFPSAEARKVALMKQAGFNAVRTAHNPPSRAFLDECDRQGLLVIDESFDGWRQAKTPYDYTTHFDSDWASDLEAMVLRDRNHPSIFCWSIGNEVLERKEIQVVTTADRLAKAIRALDPTRPVTSALAAWDSDWEIYDPLAAVHDIVGYNYMMHRAPSDHKRLPSRVLMQTESFPRHAWSNYVAVRDNPYIFGDFVWTAIDYLGESGIGRYYYTGQTPGEHYHGPQYPWHGAYCGDIDLTGWRKPISHYRQTIWNDDAPTTIGVREPNGYFGEINETSWSVWPTWESWNWEGYEGRPVTVEVYSRAPLVRLFLNDKMIGELPAGEANACLAAFEVPYAPGTLRAEGIDENGNVIDYDTLATAGKASAIRLTPVEYGTDDNLVFVEVEIVDSKGRVVPNADPTLAFSINGGNAEILATGSADLTDTVPYTSPTRKAWKGRALAAVRRPDSGKSGRLSVSAPGLRQASLRLR